MASHIVDSRDYTEDTSIEDIEDYESTDLPDLEIILLPTGDAGSSFRTQNDPGAPFQRSNYVERKGVVDLRCSCLDVVHGLFSAGGVYATLIVLQFRFDARKLGRRFQSVNISLEFEGMEKEQTGPEVFDIAPNGKLTLVPTTQTEDVARKLGLELNAGAPVAGLTATGAIGWEKRVSSITNDETRVIGSVDLKNRNWGPSNTASWTLLENATTKSGVPSSMRAAILLKRKNEDPFQCVVKINAAVDVKSRLERMWGGKGRVPNDDPVLFDPEMESTNNLQRYDVEELGAVNLASLSDVLMTTVLDGVVKHKPQ